MKRWCFGWAGPLFPHLVYFVNDVRLCDAEEIVVALQWKRVLFKLIPPEMFLFQFMLLDHGPHPAIQDQDLLLQHSS